MNHQYKLLLFLGIIIFLQSCQEEEPIVSEDEFLDIKMEVNIKRSAGVESLDFFRMPDSENLDAIPQDPQNPLSHYKVALGKLMYHETGLAVNPTKAMSVGNYSCASCHFASAGFQSGLRQGIGEGGSGFGIKGEGRTPNPSYMLNELDIQPIRTPTAMNGAFQKNMLWNGQFGATGMNVGTQAQWTAGTPIETNYLGYEGLEIQAIAGLGVHRMEVDTSLINNEEYKQMFDQAFPNFAESERYTKETVGLAIAAYERTVLSNQAPFQRWLQGEKTALTKEQKEGAVVFFGKGGCGDCHTGPALNSMAFYAYGMKDLSGSGTFNVNPNDAAHKGRGGFTKNPNDNYKFKVPQLYNLKDSPHYGHGSSFNSIRDVVMYKNSGVKENATVPDFQLANEFQPLNLTDSEIDALIDFLENALYDPNLMRYQPDHVYSGNCIPMNDPQSKTDLGCN
ncbi:MAG: cytochrome-c peroxidase [Saprospiraceae bacterium]